MRVEITKTVNDKEEIFHHAHVSVQMADDAEAVAFRAFMGTGNRWIGGKERGLLYTTVTSQYALDQVVEDVKDFETFKDSVEGELEIALVRHYTKQQERIEASVTDMQQDINIMRAKLESLERLVVAMKEGKA